MIYQERNSCFRIYLGQAFLHLKGEILQLFCKFRISPPENEIRKSTIPQIHKLWNYTNSEQHINKSSTAVPYNREKYTQPNHFHTKKEVFSTRLYSISTYCAQAREVKLVTTARTKQFPYQRWPRRNIPCSQNFHSQIIILC